MRERLISERATLDVPSLDEGMIQDTTVPDCAPKFGYVWDPWKVVKSFFIYQPQNRILGFLMAERL